MFDATVSVIRVLHDARQSRSRRPSLSSCDANQALPLALVGVLPGLGLDPYRRSPARRAWRLRRCRIIVLRQSRHRLAAEHAGIAAALRGQCPKRQGQRAAIYSDKSPGQRAAAIIRNYLERPDRQCQCGAVRGRGDAGVS